MDKSKPLLWAFGIFMAIMLVIITNFGYDAFVIPPEYPVYQPGQTQDYTLYEQQMEKYNFDKFIFLSVFGAVLVIMSLFIELLPFEVGLTFAGFAMMIMGLTNNWNDKIKVFVASIIILGLIILVLYKKLIKR